MQTKKLAISVFGTGMAMKVETQKAPKRKNPTYESNAANVPCAENAMENNAQRNNAVINPVVQEILSSKNIGKAVKERKGK